MNTHHNPSISRPIISRLLTELGEQWEDISYHNDTMASIGFETLEGDWIKILVPNALECDEMSEETSIFFVNVCDEFYPRYNTIEELLEAFKGGVSEFYDSIADRVIAKEA